MLTCQHFHEQHITSERRKQLDANFGTKRMLQALHDVTESVQKYKADMSTFVNKNVDMSTFCQHIPGESFLIGHPPKFQAPTPIIKEDTPKSRHQAKSLIVFFFT